MKQIKIIFVALFLLPIFCSSQSFFSKEIINCAVEIDREDSAGNRELHGTGFQLYSYDSSGDVKIVTCAHLLKNRFIYIKIPASDAIIAYGKKKKIPYIEFQERKQIWEFDGLNLVTKLELIKGKTFIVHDTLDIGVFKLHISGTVSPSKESKEEIDFTDAAGIPKSFFSERKNVELGDQIYFIGFPFSIGSKYGFYGHGLYGSGNERINPVIRTGTVAWKSEKHKEFLLDAFSYGGNSGSPIFTQASGQTGPTKLIGMVFAHLYDLKYPKDTADFNFGLARCVWIDDILVLADRLK